MTLPTSKILKANKSLVAAANIKNQSPSTEQAQQQNVNIVVNSSTPDLRAATEQATDTRAVYPDNQTETNEENPYANIALRDLAEHPLEGLSARTLREAKETTEDLAKLVSEKDNIIKALSIIVDIYRNNPLIINKYLIAEEETLTELIKLLTNAELIKLLTNATEVSIELADIECSCVSAQYQTIKRIYLTVEGQIYSLELCPAVMSFLEGFKISLNLVKI